MFEVSEYCIHAKQNEPIEEETSNSAQQVHSIAE